MQQYATLNASKANFDNIYDQPDPRGYFSVLGALDYMIPDVAEPIIRQILTAREKRTGVPPTVLDVGCSYGINAAVHRFPLSFRRLRLRYANPDMAALDPEELARLDRNYYGSWPHTGSARFIGLDISAPAVRYAVSVGLLDAGVIANFESGAPRPEDRRTLSGADVVLSTGCVGYVTERTFAAVLDSLERPPWVISFVLRMFPYDAIAATLAERGLVTEKLAGATFVQRRFRDPTEFGNCLATLEKLGIDTTGLEAEGRFQAELFVSRPREDGAAAPLGKVVTVVSGRNRTVGTRYVRVGRGADAQVLRVPS
ncbi:MAG: class I SAM-dependent methyltransferase [Steroidobacteraceae bacterium]